MEKNLREWLSQQGYRQVSDFLEQLSEFKRVCNLLYPPFEFDEVVEVVNEIVKGYVHGVQLEVERFCESHLKSFPHVFPKSWNDGIIDKVEKEIEKKGNEALLLLKNKETARNCIDKFKRCIIEMGGILFEVQIFSNFTKGIMYSILESCLLHDWGYPYLFELGLSLQKGDESMDDAYNSIGQSVVAEFLHFKKVLTMVWNQETSQKPPEDTVMDIKVLRPNKTTIESLLLDAERGALLGRYYAFEAAYRLVLSEYLPLGLDLGKLVTQTIELAKSLTPLQCSSGWTSQVKYAIPQLLARIFAMFTIVKSGESYNRLMENSREERVGHNLLMKPHNIQVLTLLQLVGCNISSNESLENLLMQIRTGEGKSMILGAASALFGLLGFRVRCVCYSDYLSGRDYSLFNPIFQRLNLEKHVSYSTITTLSEDSTARIGDIRALTERLLTNDLSDSRFSCPENGNASDRSLALTKQNDQAGSFPTFHSKPKAVNMLLENKKVRLGRCYLLRQKQPTEEK